LSGEPGDVPELDELWSFVQKKTQTLWLWVALLPPH
jgi:IS1 family transposase